MAALDNVNELQFKHNTFTGAGFHQVKAYVEGKTQPVGQLRWDTGTGEIKGVSVFLSQRRAGVATALLNEARANGPKPEPHHSVIRTDKGDAWARSTGDTLPPR
jgi:hypothetical protein